jgi:hypothetical protein
MTAARFATYLLVGLLWIATGVEAGTPGLSILSPRALGMGGAAVAVRGMEDPFFINPALLHFNTASRLTLFDTRLGFNDNMRQIYRFYRNNKEDIDNIDQLSDARRNELYSEALRYALEPARLLVQGPLPVSYVRPNFGIGFFSQAIVDAEIFQGAAGIPIVDFAFRGDTQLMASFSGGTDELLPGRLAAGISVKYLNRWVSSKVKSLAGFGGDEEFDVYRASSFGVDLGAAYQATPRLLVGAAWYDLFSSELKWTLKNGTGENPPADERIEPRFRIGAAYYPPLGLGFLLKDVVVAFDINEPFDGDVTFFKKLHFGASASVTPVVKIRAGLNQGYPTLGGGLDLAVVRLDYVFYGEELGQYAGQIPRWNHLLRVQIAF